MRGTSWQAMLVALAVLAVLALAGLAAACNPDRLDAPRNAPAGAGDRKLAAAEVEALFASWACPRNPEVAVQTFRPKAVASPSVADGWVLRTFKGDFAMREADRAFVPSAEASSAAEELRRSDRCR